MKYNTNVYAIDYYTKNNNNSSHFRRTLKYQDAFPAICFVLGLAVDYDKALDYMGITRHDSLNFTGNGPVRPYNNPEKMYPLWDTAGVAGIGIEQQMEVFKTNIQRKPKGILDIGTGRMETSLVFSELGIPVIALEPAPSAKQMLNDTANYWKLNPENVTHISSIEELKTKDLTNIDTILFCCSIEHLYLEDTHSIFDLILPIMRGNKGLLVVANTINQYPLPVDGSDHVVCVNNEYFANLAQKYGLKVIYHENNMFIAEF